MRILNYKRRLARLEQAIGVPSEYPRYAILHVRFSDGEQALPDIHYIKRAPHSYWEDDRDYDPDESGSEGQETRTDRDKEKPPRRNPGGREELNRC
jgi:hypothetical protein